MAVTKIKPIKSTLSKALDYIQNPDKTDGKMLVSSFGCSYETADIEFGFTLAQAIDKGNNLAHHLIQSFEPGEVDYEKAHEIGKQLADAVTKGQHEYVLTTHIDKGHMFANSALIGFGQGFQPVCGTNYGAGKRTRVRQAFYFCIRLGCGAVAALRAQCLTLVLTAWIVLCTMLLQTIGMAWQSSVVAAARQGLFLIPVVFILPNLLGQYRIILSADTASEVRQMPSQKRR